MDPNEPKYELTNRCTARSKQSGVRCKKQAIPGGNVCVIHGGKSPLTREAARRRLIALIDPILATLEGTMLKEAKSRSERVAALEKRIAELKRVIAERAVDPIMAGVAGGTTGHLAHTVKSVGSGPLAQVVDEYEVDTGLLCELRKHEEQLRVELTEFGTSYRDLLDRSGLVAKQKIEVEDVTGKRLIGVPDSDF
jgi:hypothetical protein